MVIEEALLSEILAAVNTNKGPFAGMDTVVDIEVGFSCVSFGADCADEWLFSSVDSDVFLQRIVVIACFFADWTHEIGRLGVGGHVRS